MMSDPKFDNGIRNFLMSCFICINWTPSRKTHWFLPMLVPIYMLRLRKKPFKPSNIFWIMIWIFESYSPHKHHLWIDGSHHSMESRLQYQTALRMYLTKEHWAERITDTGEHAEPSCPCNSIITHTAWCVYTKDTSLSGRTATTRRCRHFDSSR